MTRGIAFQLTFALFCLPWCNGDELTLYVQPSGNGTICPPGTNSSQCRLLSDYARDQSLFLDSNTSLVFLPGDHVLDVEFLVNFSDVALSLKPMEAEDKVLITCGQNGFFYFQNLRSVEVMFLTFHSCNGNFATRYGFVLFLIHNIENVTFWHCTFTNNSDKMLNVSESTLVFTGNQVRHNLGRWMNLQYSSTRFIDNVFTNNSGEMLDISESTLLFAENKVRHNLGTWMVLQCSSAIFTDNVFTDNIASTTDILAGIDMDGSSLTTTGTNFFSGNSGGFGGILSAIISTINLGGNVTFVSNRGRGAGVLVAASLQLVLSGSVYFENNTGSEGGVFSFLSSQINVSGDVTVSNNHASYGGAFYLISSTVTFMNVNNATFSKNRAINGGAIYLGSGSSIDFLMNESGSVVFVNNTAKMRGGAIYIQDSNTLSYCLGNEQGRFVAQQCSFKITDIEEFVNLQTRIYFSGNYADEAGTVTYGGFLDNCILETNSDTHQISGDDLFDQIADYSDSDIQSMGDTGVNRSSISSDPFKVCGCNGSEPNCDMTSLSYTIFPGAVVHVSVVGLGQRNGRVPSTIMATEHDLAIEDLEKAQGIPNECSNLSYTVYAQPGNASLVLYAGGTCLTQGIGLTIELKILSCPPGFVMTTIANNKEACICDSRLMRYTNTCNPNDGTILRVNTMSFWVGYDQDSGGIILYPTCPFDYCTTDEISFKLEDGDAQCNYNREGILCGQCSDGRSIVLGSSKCKKCSNSYLALLLSFAAAGVFLVAFLLLLNLTVAVGTINGLIFYANIVAANMSLLYPTDPNTYLNILKVFIAWINLDFGIESCFYNGMDAYAKTWLEYVFPFYIWFLIGLVFLVSHFSTTASRYLGTNPVSIFATLILLSYTKTLRTIIEAFSAATLDYEKKLVWLYDGNVPYLDIDDGRHLGLFIASLLILVFLFIPYTLLLLTSQWLLIKSHWKILSWLNNPRLRAFLDAYHAPYKPRHRYWTGLLLIIRFPAQLAAAVGNPIVNFLVIQILVLLLQAWFSINGGIYRKWYLNVLEAFFHVNIGLLAASVLYTASGRDSSNNKSLQAVATSTLVTATLVVTIGIVIFHAYRRLNIKCTKPADEPSYQEDNHLEVATPPTQSYVDIHARARRLETAESVARRESLLEDISS